MLLVLLPTPELHRRAPSPEGPTGQSPTPSGLLGTRTSWEALPSLRTALLRVKWIGQALLTPPASHLSRPVRIRPVASWSRIWSRVLSRPRRASTAPHLRVARKRSLHDGRRSDVRDQFSLVSVGRPRPSTMNAASSVPADPGSRATGRCAGQGSLGRSDRTRAWPPRMRSPSPDTPQAWTQRSRAAREKPPEPDRWTGLT